MTARNAYLPTQDLIFKVAVGALCLLAIGLVIKTLVTKKKIINVRKKMKETLRRMAKYENKIVFHIMGFEMEVDTDDIMPQVYIKHYNDSFVQI